MILFDSVPFSCHVMSCPDAVRSHFGAGCAACESVGMKESTLVINVNRPFMLRGRSPGLYFANQYVQPLLLNALLVGQE